MVSTGLGMCVVWYGFIAFGMAWYDVDWFWYGFGIVCIGFVEGLVGFVICFGLGLVLFSICRFWHGFVIVIADLGTGVV